MPWINYDDMPYERKQSKREKVMYSNGFVWPFSERDNSEPACYRYSWLKEEPSIESIGASLREKQKMKDSIRRIMQRDTFDDENSIDER